MIEMFHIFPQPGVSCNDRKDLEGAVRKCTTEAGGGLIKQQLVADQRIFIQMAAEFTIAQ